MSFAEVKFERQDVWILADILTLFNYLKYNYDEAVWLVAVNFSTWSYLTPQEESRVQTDSRPPDLQLLLMRASPELGYK